jgi:hypothetical protein
VSTEDPQDGFRSYDADNTVSVIDEVSCTVVVVANFSVCSPVSCEAIDTNRLNHSL